MATILCYGDSLTWGGSPYGGRFPPHCRWPEILNELLGNHHNVINFGLPGRTTMWDDPFNEGRNGAKYVNSAMEIFGPVNLLIIMLGTNDLKRYFNASAYEAAKGVEQIIKKVRQPNEHEFPTPKILIVAPPTILSPKGEAAEVFKGGVEKSRDLHQAYQKVAIKNDCLFVNAAGLLQPSVQDGVHLDTDGNSLLASALCSIVSDSFKG